MPEMRHGRPVPPAGVARGKPEVAFDWISAVHIGRGGWCDLCSAPDDPPRFSVRRCAKSGWHLYVVLIVAASATEVHLYLPQNRTASPRSREHQPSITGALVRFSTSTSPLSAHRLQTMLVLLVSSAYPPPAQATQSTDGTSSLQAHPLVPMARAVAFPSTALDAQPQPGKGVLTARSEARHPPS